MFVRGNNWIRSEARNEMSVVIRQGVARFHNADVTESDSLLRSPVDSVLDDYFTSEGSTDAGLRKPSAHCIEARTQENIVCRCTNTEEAVTISPITATSSRRSSLKDTSLTKFPKTPKTKAVRWPEDEFLVTYREDDEEIKRKTEEFLEQLSRDEYLHQTRRGSIVFRSPYIRRRGWRGMSESSQGLKRTLSDPISYTSMTKRPKFPSREAFSASSVYQVGDSHETRAGSMEGFDQERCNAGGTFGSDQEGLAFGFVKPFWEKLRDSLKATPLKLGNPAWLQNDTFLYEDDRNAFIGRNSGEYTRGPMLSNEVYDNIISTGNHEDAHELSEIRLPTKLSWAHIAELSPSFITFRCKSNGSSYPLQGSRPRREGKSNWFRRFLTWRPAMFSHTSTLSTYIKYARGMSGEVPGKPRQFLRPGLHSRSHSEILRIVKMYSGIKLRETRKVFFMSANRQGQETLKVVGGCGTGLSVVFEEDSERGVREVGKDGEDGEVEVVCWKCDSCEECLQIVLKQVHPCWGMYERTDHTCCSPVGESQGLEAAMSE